MNTVPATPQLPQRAGALTRTLVLALGGVIVLGVLIAWGLSWSGQQSQAARQRAAADYRIETDRLSAFERVDPVKFFEGGGVYADNDDPAIPKLDREHVLPMVLELRKRFSLDPFVLVRKSEKPRANWSGVTAEDIVMELPSDQTQRSAMVEYFVQVEDTLPGAVLIEMGDRWLSLDFLDQEAAQILND